MTPDPPPSATHASPSPAFEVADTTAIEKARNDLDAHTVEMMAWHFHPSTGCPFWLHYAQSLPFNPLKDVNRYDDLKKFPRSKTNGCVGGHCNAGFLGPLWIKHFMFLKLAARPECLNLALHAATSAPTTNNSAQHCPRNISPVVPTGSCWGHRDHDGCVSQLSILPNAGVAFRFASTSTRVG